MRLSRCCAVLVLIPTVLLCQSSLSRAEGPARRSILMIYPFDRSLPFGVRFLSGFADALRPYDLNMFDIFQENLDMDRIDSEEYLDSLAAFYTSKYASKHFDAIITMNSASEFLFERCKALSPGTPVVAFFSLPGERGLPESSGRKIVPVFCDKDIGKTVDLIVHLQPGVEKIYVVVGTHPFEQATIESVRNVAAQFKTGPEFVFLTQSRYDELLGVVSGLRPNNAIFFISFMMDTLGKSFCSQYVAGRLSETAGCPVYGISDTYMDGGIVGGWMLPAYRIGLSSGEALLGLLRMNGGKAAQGEIRVPPARQVDERQIARWRLSEDNLPDGYEVVNRAPSLWRDYRKHVATALLFILAQSALIFCLLIQRRRRRAAERAAHERAEQLVHADKMISLGIMAAGITHEIQNPNNFISLNAPVLKMTWEGALERLDEYAEENGDFLIGKVPYSRVRTHVPVLMNGIIEGSERIRNIVRDMKEFVSQKHAGTIEKVDVNAVLKSSLNLLANKLGKSTNNLFVAYGENIPAVKANAQRVGQVMVNLVLNGAESLTDKGKLLSIRTYYEPERAMVGLEVKDAGSGIEPEHLKRVFDPFFTTKRETGGTGLGLAISQRIVEAYGGRILISSIVGEGTTAVLELPACSENG